MSNLLRRFKYYGIGFVIGSIFVAFFFQNRGCSWLPKNRVKNTFFDKVLVIPDDQQEKFNELGLTDELIFSFLVDGDVRFKESIKEINTYPKAYVLEKVINDRSLKLQFSLYEDSYITPIHVVEDSVKKFENLSGMGRFMRVPRDSALLFIDRKNYVQCKAQPLFSKDLDVLTQAVKNSGRIDFSKSNLMLPKAEHFILFESPNGDTIKAKTIWFESRITFKDFYWDEEMDCK